MHTSRQEYDKWELGIIRAADPEIAASIENERKRQARTIELIASENIVSRAVRAAQGCILTNKYAEGYPEKRYYGGCENADRIESLAISRACQLFKAHHANVQPHSGSQANMAAYFAMIDPGDTILCMDLAHGGHLTHGSPVNFSGRIFKAVHYGVERESGRINYAQISKMAKLHRPKLIVAGASAYPRVIDFAKIYEIAIDGGASFMVDMAHIAGLVAAELHPSPVPYADIVTSTTHKTLRGPRGGLILTNKEKFVKRIDKQIFPGTQGGPLMHVIAAKAVALNEALSPEFNSYQKRIINNAKHLADRMQAHGFKLVSDGTDNHMILVDLTNLGVTGKDAETALDRVGITTNKNAIPFDSKGPTVTSGIRIGTSSVTTRGMGKDEMALIAGMIDEVLHQPDDNTFMHRIHNKVLELCKSFPLHEDSVF